MWNNLETRRINRRRGEKPKISQVGLRREFNMEPASPITTQVRKANRADFNFSADATVFDEDI
ncbi:hypothetical protein [Calderihabitans maritimus]|uniref:Uncharacterized protein n=1 Tax=Calderihabitans maritimus TaxID=1246530 RepID=A0A1Z5HS16_9FIRM|nr:hypothetical protein [Calderihabitans maritimus]GAW92157.1 hypothetical protein KKC1_13160 [Calderihabitans maritimus]